MGHCVLMWIATENDLSNSQFLHLSKKGSASLQEEYVDPAWILLRAVIYLETNSITIGPFFLCFKRKFIEKCPPPHFWRKFYGGKFNFDDNWASHKVRTLLAYPGLAYLSFSYVWNIKKHITTKHYQNIVLVFKNSPDFVCKSENFQKPFNTFF